ncbi:MAG TPA: cytochrome c [Acetobacteraceae bacterium]|nr:cytochrome c [Acetobacteraceae bacterium]
MKARCCARFGAVLLLGVMPVCASPLLAGAQDTGDSAAGRRIAERWCSDCHVIGPGQQRGTSYGAPPFEAVARMASITPMALRVFLQTPHGRMPDLHMSRAEIDDVIAYILSLRRS